MTDAEPNTETSSNKITIYMQIYVFVLHESLGRHSTNLIISVKLYTQSPSDCKGFKVRSFTISDNDDSNTVF